VRRDERGGRGRDQGQPRRDHLDTGGAHGLLVGGGLRAATGPDGGLDQVKQDPQGVGGVGGEDTRRADRRGVPIGILEVTASQRGHRTHVMGSEVGLPDPPWRSPSHHRGRQRVRRVVGATGRGDQRLAIANSPGLQQVAMS